MASLAEQLNSEQNLTNIIEGMNAIAQDRPYSSEEVQSPPELDIPGGAKDKVQPEQRSRKPLTKEKQLFEQSESFRMFQHALNIKMRAAERFANKNTELVSDSTDVRKLYRDTQREVRDEIVHASKELSQDPKSKVSKLGRQETKLINKFLGVDDSRTMEILEMAHEITDKASEVQLPPYQPSRYLVAEGEEPVAKLRVAKKGTVVESASLSLDRQRRDELAEEYTQRYKLNKTQASVLELFMAMSPEERELVSGALLWRRDKTSEDTLVIEDQSVAETHDEKSSDSEGSHSGSKSHSADTSTPEEASASHEKEKESKDGKEAPKADFEAKARLADKKRLEALQIMRRLGNVPVGEVSELIGRYKEGDEESRGKWIFDPIERIVKANGNMIPADIDSRLDTVFDKELGNMAFEHRKYFMRHILKLGLSELALTGRLSARKLLTDEMPEEDELRRLGSYLRRTFNQIYRTKYDRMLSAEDFGVEA